MRTVRHAYFMHIAATYSYENRQSPEYMLQPAMRTVRCACVIHVTAIYSYENRQSPENTKQLAMITVRYACFVHVAVINYSAMIIVRHLNTHGIHAIYSQT